MFVPEFVQQDRAILVHNHNLETEEATRLALAFTAARVDHGRAHLPGTVTAIDIVFDIRGQSVWPGAEAMLTAAALGADSIRFFEG